MTGGNLSDRMLARAKTDTEHADELRRMAAELDAIMPDTPIPKMVGTWARCRRRWCEITGESLI